VRGRRCSRSPPAPAAARDSRRFDPEAFSTAAALAAAPVAFAAVLLFAPWAGAPTTEQLAAMPRALAAAALPS
jgi:hypothetical protein